MRRAVGVVRGVAAPRWCLLVRQVPANVKQRVHLLVFGAASRVCQGTICSAHAPIVQSSAACETWRDGVRNVQDKGDGEQHCVRPHTTFRPLQRCRKGDGARSRHTGCSLIFDRKCCEQCERVLLPGRDPYLVPVAI